MLELSEREFALLYMLVNQSVGALVKTLGLGKLTHKLTSALYHKLMSNTALFEGQESLRKVLEAPVVQEGIAWSVVKKTSYQVVMDLTEAEFALLYTLLNAPCRDQNSLVGVEIPIGLGMTLWSKLSKITEHTNPAAYFKGIVSAKQPDPMPNT